MSSPASAVDLSHVSADEFARFVAAATDEQLEAALRAVGAEPVLDRIFAQMRERFLPERAEGIAAEVQFIIADDAVEHPYGVRIADRSCAIRRETLALPRVTLRLPLVSFAKLVTGCAEGPQLFVTGRLKLSGDLVLALKLLGLFDRPKAG